MKEINEKMLKQLKAKKKVFSLLSLAQKAGYAGSGEFITEKSVKEGTARLVIVSSDASDNTKKMFNNMCAYYNVPIYIYGSKEELGHSIGKEFRASVVIRDEGMAKVVIKQIELENAM